MAMVAQGLSNVPQHQCRVIMLSVELCNFGLNSVYHMRNMTCLDCGRHRVQYSRWFFQRPNSKRPHHDRYRILVSLYLAQPSVVSSCATIMAGPDSLCTSLPWSNPAPSPNRRNWTCFLHVGFSVSLWLSEQHFIPVPNSGEVHKGSYWAGGTRGLLTCTRT